MRLPLRWTKGGYKSNSGHMFKFVIGRRGLILVLTGLIWVLYGVALLIRSTSRFTIDDKVGGGTNILQLLDSRYVGWFWVLCGAVAMAVGLMRSRRVVTPHDSIGFNAILLPAIVWALLYFWSWVSYFYTNHEIGNPAGIVGTLVWFLVTGFILIIAGWPEPPNTKVIARQDN